MLEVADFSKFQKTMEDIFKQKQISQREYLIQKIKEEQEHADSNIKSGDLMAAMAFCSTINLPIFAAVLFISFAYLSRTAIATI